MRDDFIRDLVWLTAASGLRLESLTVEGREHTSPEDIRAALDVTRGTPILTINVAEAREALEALPWVKAARVERQLPNTVHVVIQEREPFALWQKGSRYFLVDRDGTPIIAVPDADPSTLKRPEDSAAELIAAIAAALPARALLTAGRAA